MDNRGASADGAPVASLGQGRGYRDTRSVRYRTRRLQPTSRSSTFVLQLEPETGQASVAATSPAPIVKTFTNSAACRAQSARLGPANSGPPRLAPDGQDFATRVQGRYGSTRRAAATPTSP